MKSTSQKHNWIIDAVLFTGFIIAFMLDLTGLTWHQWLGVFIGVLATYHLLSHWNWIKAVTTRYISGTSRQARTYYIIDAGLFLGFFLILVTGLIISTWFAFPLNNYIAWLDTHILISIITLFLVVVKIGLHWQWVVKTFKRVIPAPRLQPVPNNAGNAIRKHTDVSRREFLSLMGIVGAASIVSIFSALAPDSEIVAAASSGTELSEEEQLEKLVQQMREELVTQQAIQPTQNVSPPKESAIFSEPLPEPTATESAPVAIITQESQTSNCVVRCNRSCSYPGHCRKYVDQNQNNLCDLGECI